MKMRRLNCSIAVRPDSLTLTQHEAEAAKWNLDIFNFIICTHRLFYLHLEKSVKKAPKCSIT